MGMLRLEAERLWLGRNDGHMKGNDNGTKENRFNKGVGQGMYSTW